MSRFGRGGGHQRGITEDAYDYPVYSLDGYSSFEPMPESSGAELAAAMRASQGQTQRAWDSSWDYRRARAGGNPAEIRAARAAARQAWETEMRTKGAFLGEGLPTSSGVLGLAVLALIVWYIVR